ncbi:EscF/YscF/HrpA family type III secretion system needle major subunit [Endozoicomonas sp. SCSIO W0465]|uniref:EscF/YscF/HrpA family type III secretion system needle major subunit n=1 Tax=Endozoicomonas sp. SCSIO W0465 TaxID=2918516 RepID=UPI002075DCE3|nr:EscF/YscF/HrpA family type III secretion system needle major subunit [Endozoicomonas sp. SCSIO W0465]USE39028.1 EscF/YscF/HrpA family type III secretion system needle major subunit [Endozoicomonas sp. SCSIO W0465]
MAYQDTYNPNYNQPGSSGFSFDKVSETFGSQAEALDAALKTRVANMDPNSTKDMVEFQVEFNKYMIVEGLRSSIVKSIKDTIQSIIQKL